MLFHYSANTQGQMSTQTETSHLREPHVLSEATILLLRASLDSLSLVSPQYFNVAPDQCLAQVVREGQSALGGSRFLTTVLVGKKFSVN